MKRSILYIAAMMLTLTFVACENDEMAVNTNTNVPQSISVSDLIANYTTESGVYQPVRTRSNGDYAKNLFTIDTIPSSGPDIMLVGRVVSDDMAGNLYKTLVIQDINDPKRGIKISVDGSNISGLYPYGQLIAVRLNGFCIGKYAGQYQIGVAAYNNNTIAQNASQKVGWAIGRIPLNLFVKATTAYGVAEPDKVVIHEMTIDEIRQSDIHEVAGRFVRIKNVHFTSQYYLSGGDPADCTDGDPRTDTNSAVFAPTTDFIGYSQSRIFADERGNTMATSTSEYAKFAYYRLPASEYVGDVVGIVGYYYDNPRYRSNPSSITITLRGIGLGGSVNDLVDFTNPNGAVWEPKEWAED